MVRIFNVYHAGRTFALVCSETFLILLGFLGAFLLRLGPAPYSVLSSPAGMGQMAVMTLTCVLCLYYFNLYDFQTIGNRRELLRRFFQVFGTASLIQAGIYYLFPGLVVARGAYAVGVFLLLIILFATRMAFAWLNQLPTAAERVVLIGMSPIARDLARDIRQRPELGINLVGYVDAHDSTSQLFSPLKRLGNIEDLESLVQSESVDVAILALRERRGRLNLETLLKLRMGGLKFFEATTIYERITGQIPVGTVLPSGLIFSEGFRIRSRAIALQTALSLLVAFAAMVLALPLMGLIALGIRLDSPGPILFRQKRVGRNDHIFTLYKFRSMRVDAERETGAVWASKEDDRVTRVGRFLRKFRLDELPQLWNILCGDMNLVGPRPERPEFTQMLEKEIPYYQFRHAVRPGLTGWAQVRYPYGATVADQQRKLHFDLFYVKNISFSLDLYILFETGKIVLFGRGAH